MSLAKQAAPRAEQRPAPAVNGVEIKKVAGATRVALRLSAPVEAAVYLLANPERAIVDLPEVAFRFDSSARQPAALRRSGVLVSDFRVGLLEAGKSRAVFDLTGPARIAATRIETVNGAQQLVVDFVPTSRADFLAAVRAAAPIAPKGASEGAPGQKAVAAGKPVIVLDPGHGGIDAGARGATQALEKDIVLAFAQTLGEKLEKTGRYQVVLTRTEDVFVSLAERVRIAREAGAKLFISIHADSLNERWVEGATVYTVSDRASDAHAARLAEKENRADALAGVEAGEATGEITDILFELARKETRAFSHYFARSLVNYWKEAGKLNKNPLRSAGFRVLMAPDVPSVLLELGYLSSRTEAIKLTQPQWRASAAAAIVRSVDAFFVTPGGLAHPGPSVAKDPAVASQSERAPRVQ